MEIQKKVQNLDKADRRKVLFVVEAMGGGVFTYIVELSNALCDTFDITVAYAIRPQTPSNYVDYFDNRVHLIKVENFCRSINFVRDMKACLEIYGIAKKVNPDIIHLHSSKAGILGRIVFAHTKAKLFYTPHGYSFLMKNRGVVERVFYKALEKIFAIKRCKTISCSRGEYNESRKLTKNATFVSNGINIDEIDSFCKKLSKRKNVKLTVFTLGRICEQKNPALFNKIAEMCPDIDFIWIGDGELRQKLNASNIQILGWCNREEALKCAYQADVFILTSLWEGLPMSLLEAMYLKKLCIVSDVIGNRDVIQNDINGYICRTVDEYVNVLTHINDEKIRKLEERAYDDVVKEYSIKIMSKKYIKIYNGE